MDEQFNNCLTDRQKECLEFIIRMIKKRGIPPTIKELADHLQVTRSPVDKLLLYLEQKGYITRSTKLGSIKLLKDPDGDPVTVIVTILKKEQQ